MKNYWSCSKFADWLRGVPKPSAATRAQWKAWEDHNITANKFRFWLAEDGLDYLQSTICWPITFINTMYFYFYNRWVIKSHVLASNLKRGRWYEFDTRLLHAAFDELINFVEIELAWKFIICSEEEYKKYKMPWYRTFFHLGRWRNANAGQAYLVWASSLMLDEDWVNKNDPDYGKPTKQALVAKEITKLYTWWKEERPKRPDPSDASGWSKYCEEKRKEAEASGVSLYRFISNNKNECAERALTLYHQIEEEQIAEDTHMLISLIQIRQSLWT